MRLTLGASVGAVGLLLPFAVASSLLSSTVTGFVLARTGMGRLLAMGTALCAAALAVFGLAPAFWVLIPAIMLLAAGSGGVDAALNAYAAHRFLTSDRGLSHLVAGVQVAASAIGSATIPALVGVLIEHFGTAVLGPCLLVLAVAVAAAYTAARRAGTGAPTAQDAAPPGVGEPAARQPAA